MTALRIIPLPLHSALELLLGIGLGVAPFALGLSAAATIVGVVAGVLIVGLALQSLDTGVGVSAPIAAHLAGDQGVALGLAAAGGVMAFSGDEIAAALFAATALLQLVLISSTRYTAR